MVQPLRRQQPRPSPTLRAEGSLPGLDHGVQSIPIMRTTNLQEVDQFAGPFVQREVFLASFQRPVYAHNESSWPQSRGPVYARHEIHEFEEEGNKL